MFPVHSNIYPLLGAHAEISSDCASCHNGNYNNTPQECIGCHLDDYNNTTNPDHQNLLLANTCEDCHTFEAGWKPAQFPIHGNFYPLLGAHTAISNDCSSCHNGNYITTPNNCAGCHLDNYNNTTNPNHAALNFSTDCETCHIQSAWTPSTFDHDVQYFPIYSGAHNEKWSACSDCHTIATNYQIFECINCHEHNQIDMDDKHQGISGYIYQSQACYDCHPDGTSQGAFNHSQTNFELTGAHLGLDCSDCHQSGYSGTSSLCYDCHNSNYNATTNPDHQSLALASTCGDCHTTQPGWKPAQFPIHSNYYPLLGAHGAISGDCASCHNGNYNTTPSECIGCHSNNYNNTTNPDHQALSLATTCEDCHTLQAGWAPAQFPIHSNYFALVGAHAVISNDCAACHNGNYNSISDQCYDCHQNAYTASTNPPHASAGFPTDCETCHTAFAWVPSTFDHDGQYFPIYSGHHNNEWDLCSDCHVNSSNYAIFECILCHEHNQQSMNEEHSGVQNYVYLSIACYQCHPNGNSIPIINTHNQKKLQ